MAVEEYVLKTPIVIESLETIEVLRFEEPTLGKMDQCGVSLDEKDLMKIKGMSALLNACVLNASPLQISRMKLGDLSGAVEACTGFFS